MSLHIKYRPRMFRDFVGNEDVVRSLAAVLKKDDRPHAMLFTGPSGCGKTTLARIAAAKLEVGSHDLVELNAADFRGIDTVRDLLRNMRLRPMNGPCRVWILDECHQLSKDAQSALLKALEDTPSHVYFMLATTDPDKLIPTIRNRCHAFEVRPLDEDELVGLMNFVLKKEKATVPDKVLRHVADVSMGSSRFALVLLDKLTGLQPQEMEKAIDRLAAQESEAIELCRALIGRAKWPTVAKVLSNMKLESYQVEQVRRTVLGYCQSVLLRSGDARAFVVMDAFRQPFYDLGKPGLVMACYEAVQ